MSIEKKEEAEYIMVEKWNNVKLDYMPYATEPDYKTRYLELLLKYEECANQCAATSLKALEMAENYNKLADKHKGKWVDDFNQMVEQRKGLVESKQRFPHT